MRSIEEKIDIPESRKDDFRQEIMNYIGTLALDGKKFEYNTNARLLKAVEFKLFEDQRDTIKLKNLVSSVVDDETQQKIDVVKQRLIKYFGYNENSATDVLNYVASIFARGDRSRMNSLRAGLASASVHAMILKIEKDHQRFRQIVKGRIRRTCAALTKGELIGKEGKHLIASPSAESNSPFPLRRQRQASARRRERRRHCRQGPRCRPPGRQRARAAHHGGRSQPRRTGRNPRRRTQTAPHRTQGQAPHHHRPRQIPRHPAGRTRVPPPLQTLLQGSPQAADHDRRITIRTNPIIIPQKKDIRYRSWKEVKSPQSNAVIVFMMDVSGSMGEEQKELVRLESFWIDTWLRKNYEGIESRYIVHDVRARKWTSRPSIT